MEIVALVFAGISAVSAVIFGIMTVRVKKEVKEMRLIINGNVKIANKDRTTNISRTGTDSINIGGDIKRI